MPSTKTKYVPMISQSTSASFTRSLRNARLRSCSLLPCGHARETVSEPERQIEKVAPAIHVVTADAGGLVVAVHAQRFVREVVDLQSQIHALADAQRRAEVRIELRVARAAGERLEVSATD